jgi:hypothetical protein
VGLFGDSDMKVYTSEIKRSPWAQQVTVSRTMNGRWVINRGSARSELPASTFNCWAHAEWTANAWANEEYKQSLAESV